MNDITSGTTDLTVALPWGGSKRFTSYDEAQSWADEQVQFIASFEQTAGHFGKAAHELISAELREWRSHANNLRGNEPDKFERFNAFVQGKPRLNREDPALASAQADNEKDPFKATALLIWFLAERGVGGNGAIHQPSQLQVVQAMIEARLDRRGGTSAEVQEIAHRELREQWDAQFRGLEGMYKGAFGTTNDLGVKTISDLTARDAAYGDLLAAHEARMEKIQEDFVERMKLQAPVGYWDDRAKKAGKRAGDFWRAFSVMCVSLAGAALGLLFFMNAVGLVPKTEHFPFFFVAAALVFWMLRHVAREFARSTDEAADARERVAMVQTFLALDTDNRVSDAERLICLNALFRPRAVTGDDSGPSHPFLEEILKIARK